MKRLVLCVLVMYLPAIGLAKHKNYEMRTAKVLSQDIEVRDRGAAVMPLAGGLIGVPLSQRTNTVVVETDQRRMTWVEVDKKAIVLTVNGSVAFYQDGNYFIVLDVKGKKCKFAMVHSELLNQSNLEWGPWQEDPGSGPDDGTGE